MRHDQNVTGMAAVFVDHDLFADDAGLAGGDKRQGDRIDAVFYGEDTVAEALGGIIWKYGNRTLHDDRAFIHRHSHEMRGGAVNANARGDGAFMGLQTLEGGQD